MAKELKAGRTGWAKDSRLFQAVIAASLVFALGACGDKQAASTTPAEAPVAAPPPEVDGVTLGQDLKFSTAQLGVKYLTSGWGQPESWGTWSNAANLVTKVPLIGPITGPATLEIDIDAFVPAESPKRSVEVSVNGGPAKAFPLTSEEAKTTLKLPLSEADIAGSTLNVTYKIKSPVTPKALGLGDDTRPLGIGLRAMRIAQTR